MRIAWYILREHVAPFFYSLSIITFLFVIDFLVKLLDLVLSKHLDLWVILEIFVLNLAWMLALSIPMACLVASLMAFGRMAGDNEITALRANGVSPLKLLAPPLVVAALIGLGLIYFNNFVLPAANHRAAGLRDDVAQKRAPAFITPGALIKDFNNYRLWIDSIDYRNDVLKGVKIYYWQGGDPPRYMYAARARMEYADDGASLLIHMEEGENHILDKQDPALYMRLRFKEQTVAIENVDASLERTDRHYRSDREMPVTEMLKQVSEARAREKEFRVSYPGSIFGEAKVMLECMAGDTNREPPPRLREKPWYQTWRVTSPYYWRLQAEEKEKVYLIGRYEKKVRSEREEANKYLVEVHKKFSIPVACFIFVLVGGPLGILARRGGLGMGSILSSGFFLIYWVGLLRGEALSDKLVMSPVAAMWGPNMVVGLLSLFLLRKVMR